MKSSKSLGVRSREAVLDIADRAREWGSIGQGYSLAHGIAGLAVFYGHVARQFGRPEDATTSNELREKLIEELRATPMSASLYGGFPGIAWAIEHLHQLESSRPSASVDINAGVDEILLEYLSHPTARKNFDLVDGLVGIGAYALARRPRYCGRHLFRIVVELLEGIAEHPAVDEMTWRTSPENLPFENDRARYPAGVHNLGFAHGTPSVIALASTGIRHGYAPATCHRLIVPSINWLLRRARKRSRSTYSYLAEEHRDARVAWCYGDPGVGWALVNAGKAIGRPDLYRRGLNIARLSVLRPYRETGVVDAGLCHGSAGLLHICNRLYRITGQSDFRRGAKLWADRTLNFRRKNEGISGYTRYDPLSANWEPSIGYLEGVAGIGLALLATISPDPPHWDHVFLLSPESSH